MSSSSSSSSSSSLAAGVLREAWEVFVRDVCVARERLCATQTERAAESAAHPERALAALLRSGVCAARASSKRPRTSRTIGGATTMTKTSMMTSTSTAGGVNASIGSSMTTAALDASIGNENETGNGTGIDTPLYMLESIMRATPTYDIQRCIARVVTEWNAYRRQLRHHPAVYGRFFQHLEPLREQAGLATERAFRHATLRNMCTNPLWHMSGGSIPAPAFLSQLRDTLYRLQADAMPYAAAAAATTASTSSSSAAASASVHYHHHHQHHHRPSSVVPGHSSSRSMALPPPPPPPPPIAAAVGRAGVQRQWVARRGSAQPTLHQSNPPPLVPPQPPPLQVSTSPHSASVLRHVSETSISVSVPSVPDLYATPEQRWSLVPDTIQLPPNNSNNNNNNNTHSRSNLVHADDRMRKRAREDTFGDSIRGRTRGLAAECGRILDALESDAHEARTRHRARVALLQTVLACVDVDGAREALAAAVSLVDSAPAAFIRAVRDTVDTTYVAYCRTETANLWSTIRAEAEHARADHARVSPWIRATQAKLECALDVARRTHREFEVDAAVRVLSSAQVAERRMALVRTFQYETARGVRGIISDIHARAKAASVACDAVTDDCIDDALASLRGFLGDISAACDEDATICARIELECAETYAACRWVPRVDSPLPPLVDLQQRFMPPLQYASMSLAPLARVCSPPTWLEKVQMSVHEDANRRTARAYKVLCDVIQQPRVDEWTLLPDIIEQCDAHVAHAANLVVPKQFSRVMSLLCDDVSLAQQLSLARIRLDVDDNDGDDDHDGDGTDDSTNRLTFGSLLASYCAGFDVEVAPACRAATETLDAAWPVFRAHERPMQRADDVVCADLGPSVDTSLEWSIDAACWATLHAALVRAQPPHGTPDADPWVRSLFTHTPGSDTTPSFRDAWNGTRSVLLTLASIQK